MKQIFIAIACIFCFATVASAQRYAIIDTKYILDKIPEYKDADRKLQAVAEQWQREIDNKQAELDKMYKSFDAEKYMLSAELKKKREDEIIKKEKDKKNCKNVLFVLLYCFDKHFIIINNNN